MGPKAGSASGCLAEGAAAQSRRLHGGRHSLPSLLALQALTSQEQSSVLKLTRSSPGGVTSGSQRAGAPDGQGSPSVQGPGWDWR